MNWMQFFSTKSGVLICFALLYNMHLTYLNKPTFSYQIQAHVNRAKGNRTGMSKADLIQKSSYCRVSGILDSHRNPQINGCTRITN